MKTPTIIAALALPLLLNSCALVELPFRLIRSVTGAIVENEPGTDPQTGYIAVKHSEAQTDPGKQPAALSLK